MNNTHRFIIISFIMIFYTTSSVFASQDDSSEVTIIINSPPEVEKTSLTVGTCEDVQIKIPFEASDIDGDDLKPSYPTDVNFGTVEFKNSNFIYTPPKTNYGNEVGRTAQFTYKANDGNLDSINTTTVNIRISDICSRISINSRDNPIKNSIPAGESFTLEIDDEDFLIIDFEEAEGCNIEPELKAGETQLDPLNSSENKFIYNITNDQREHLRYSISVTCGPPQIIEE